MERRTALVLDASVVIKWFSEEEYTATALEIRDAHVDGDVELWVPDLLLYEVANALRYNPTLESVDVQEGIRSIFELDVTIVTPQLEPILWSAIDIAVSNDLTVYDATYPALAEAINTTAVTADEELAACNGTILVSEF